MSNRGLRKFACADCGETVMMRPHVRARRTRERCGACGSIALDPVSPGAKEQVKSEGDNLNDADRNAIRTRA